MDWQALTVHLYSFHVAITSMPMGQLHRTLQGMPFLISIPARDQLMVPKLQSTYGFLWSSIAMASGVGIEMLRNYKDIWNQHWIP